MQIGLHSPFSVKKEVLNVGVSQRTMPKGPLSRNTQHRGGFYFSTFGPQRGGNDFQAFWAGLEYGAMACKPLKKLTIPFPSET
jgi:hypothetical protein